MEKFTSSNGWTVTELDDGQVSVKRPAGNQEYVFWLRPPETDVLREFFQAERDAELGRWRWSTDPDYVVYPHRCGGVRVLNEATLSVGHFESRHRVAGSGVLAAAARAYFAAHPDPVPRPWEDAKPGEVWALTYDGEEGVFLHSHGAWYGQGGMRVVFDHPLRDSAITAGRRVWPEGETTT